MDFIQDYSDFSQFTGSISSPPNIYLFTVSPLYPQVLHPLIQLTTDVKYLGEKKVQKVPKSKTLIFHKPATMYIVLGIISNLIVEMV